MKTDCVIQAAIEHCLTWALGIDSTDVGGVSVHDGALCATTNRSRARPGN
jgi:hypothetical protein